VSLPSVDVTISDAAAVDVSETAGVVDLSVAASDVVVEVLGAVPGQVDAEALEAAVAAYLAANPVEVETVVHLAATRTRPSLLGEANDFVTGTTFTAPDMPAPVWLTGTSNGKNGIYTKSGSGATRTYTFDEYPEDGTFVSVTEDDTEGGAYRLWFLSESSGFAQVYPGVGSLSDLLDVNSALDPVAGQVLGFDGDHWTARDVDHAIGIHALAASAASAPSGPLYAFDDFALHDDGPLHDAETTGGAIGDPLVWTDFRVLAGGLADAYVEQAQVVDGVLRHRGTLPLVVVAHHQLPEGAREHGCAVTMGVTDDAEGGGGDGESSARIGFAPLETGNGYVAYLTSPGPTDDHEVEIVRDDEFEPSSLGGPWSLGRRLGAGDCWTFATDGQGTYAVLVNGTEVGRVTNTDHDWADIDSTAITLTTDGEWLPGVPWWALSAGNHVPGTDGGGGPALSDDDPEPLAADADPGESTAASRSDHAHALPSPGDIGAAEDSHDHDGTYQPAGTYLAGAVLANLGQQSSIGHDATGFTTGVDLLDSAVASGAAATGRLYELFGTVSVTNNSGGTRQISFALKIGSTTTTFTAAIASADGVTRDFVVVGRIILLSASLQRVHLSVAVSGQAGAAQQTVIDATTTEDMSTSKSIQLVAKSNAATATQSFQAQSLRVHWTG